MKILNNAVANKYGYIHFGYGYGYASSYVAKELSSENQRLTEELEKIQEIHDGYSNNVYPHLSDAEMTLRSADVYMTEAISKLEEHYNGTDVAIHEKEMFNDHNIEIATMLSKAESFKTNVSNRIQELEQIEAEINFQKGELQAVIDRLNRETGGNYSL